MKRFITVLAAALALMAAPAAAFAVNVSSNDGSGTQAVGKWYQCGAFMTGTLKSTKGQPVYYNGDTVYDHAVDTGWGRYTKDTKSLYPVTMRNQLGSTSSCLHPADGVHIKVCRNRNNLPDPCGSWATTIRKR